MSLSQGSPAYNEWVRVERVRLKLSDQIEMLKKAGFHFHADEILTPKFWDLTVENKKRRLLFARGRKEPLRKPRRIR